ncbi:MAG: hypothetical protein ABIP53_04955, partial [Candidatus Limnocylindrales bacterium]
MNGLGSDRSVGREAFDGFDFDPVSEEALDVGQKWLFVDAHQRDRVTLGACSTGATDAVHIV